MPLLANGQCDSTTTIEKPISYAATHNLVKKFIFPLQPNEVTVLTVEITDTIPHAVLQPFFYKNNMVLVELFDKNKKKLASNLYETRYYYSFHFKPSYTGTYYISITNNNVEMVCCAIKLLKRKKE